MCRNQPRFGCLIAALALASGCRARDTQRDLAGARLSPSSVIFTDIAERAGVSFRLGHDGKSPLNILETAGGGCAFIDFDNDGWLDLLLVGPGKLMLFRNQHDGTFTDVTSGAFPSLPPAWWMGCTVGDYDNDGYADIFVTGYNRCALLHNERNGTFREATKEAGVETPGWSLSAAFADVDNDGYLDLYVTRYVRFDARTPQLCRVGNLKSACGPEAYDPQKGVLYHNEGNGTFVDISRRAGVAAAAGKGWGVVFGDYDNDGWLDFYVANDEMPCDLYHNLGKGKFENVGLTTGTAYDAHGGLQGGMGCDFGDFNNDGRLDLFVTTYFEQAKSLYRNEGGQLFREFSSVTGLAQKTLPFVGFGTALCDLDNDGYLDVFIANGHVRDNAHNLDASASYRERMQLFLNRRGESFEEVAIEKVKREIVGRGAAFGDFDNDGRIDVLVVDLEGAALLLHNEGPRRHWLNVSCVGTKSNRAGIGARVTIWVGGQRRIAEVKTCGSVMSANDHRAHFGLADATRIDRLEMRWPSGVVDVSTNVNADQTLVVREGQSRK